jgi:tyrosine-protein phosphatase YwqE
VREGAVHVVASDAHSAGQRFMAVEPGLAHLRTLVGEAGLERLTTINPRAILSNGPVESVSPSELRMGSPGFRGVFRRFTASKR